MKALNAALPRKTCGKRAKTCKGWVRRRTSRESCRVSDFTRVPSRSTQRGVSASTGTGPGMAVSDIFSMLTVSDVRTLSKSELVHILQELGIIADLFEAGNEQFHGFDGRQGVQHAAQHEDALQVFPGNEQFFLSRAGALDVDGREDALIDQLAVEDDLHVAGSLELFEDDFVHAGACIDQRSGDDGKRAALFDVARGAEEALGPLQSVGIHAARQYFARGRNDGVVGAGQ